MGKEKIWTKEFSGMTIINAFFTIIFFLFIVTMAPYAIEEYDVSLKTAGLVASIFVIGSLIGRALAGSLIARFGESKILSTSLVIFIVISSCYFFTYTIELLFVVRILQGLVAGIIGTATGSICVKVIPPSRRGEGIAYYSSGAVLGAAVGPFIGIFLLGLENGFRWILVFNITIGIICLLILKLMKQPIHSVQQEARVKQPFTISSFIEIKAIPISLLALIISFGFSSITSYLVLYSKQINLVQAASYFFLVHAFCVICSRFFTGKWIDTKGANVVIYPCMILFSLGMLLYSQASVAWVLLSAGALISTGFGNFNSAAQTIAIRSIPPKRLGIATATYFMFIDLGSGLGPYVLGFLIEDIGFRTLYILLSLIGLICIPIYYAFYGRKEKALIQQQQNLQVNQV